MDDQHLISKVREGLRAHEQECPLPPLAVLLNPHDRSQVTIDNVDGIPIGASPEVPRKCFWVSCDGSATGVEEALREWQSIPAEAVPV